ncbi:transposase [Nocardia gipuzkoensis]|uniref:transposase n=1 Tax=Nocardia gipuzkoensis TaxID=2749991 RepID=UPI00237DF034|nr:transposase [Nocardia gipuzkoensis]MDE1675513.1 transposase [Nocardia gipuzkoensis]
MNSVHDTGCAGAVGQLSAFRQELYRCLPRRADAVFDVVDAVLCADGPVRSLAELSLVGEHRRGHGSVYAALERGRIDVARLRRALVSVPLPRAADGRLVLAVDILLVAAGSAYLPAADPVSHLRACQEHSSDDSRLAVLGGLRSGVGA